MASGTCINEWEKKQAKESDRAIYEFHICIECRNMHAVLNNWCPFYWLHAKPGSNSRWITNVQQVPKLQSDPHFFLCKWNLCMHITHTCTPEHAVPLRPCLSQAYTSSKPNRKASFLEEKHREQYSSTKSKPRLYDCIRNHNIPLRADDLCRWNRRNRWNCRDRWNRCLSVNCLFWSCLWHVYLSVIYILVLV